MQKIQTTIFHILDHKEFSARNVNQKTMGIATRMHTCANTKIKHRLIRVSNDLKWFKQYYCLLAVKCDKEAGPLNLNILCLTKIG